MCFFVRANFALDEDPSLGQAMSGMLGVVPNVGIGDSYTQWVQQMASLDPLKYPGLAQIDQVSIFVICIWRNNNEANNYQVPYSSHCYDLPFILANAIKNMITEGLDYTNKAALLDQLMKTSYNGITGTNAFDDQGNRLS